jgi:hypothetical protein
MSMALGSLRVPSPRAARERDRGSFEEAPASSTALKVGLSMRMAA